MISQTNGICDTRAMRLEQWGDTIWQGIGTDLSCYVLVVDADGFVAFMNEAAADWLGDVDLEFDDAQRVTFTKILPDGVARERHEYLQRVRESGETMVVDGIIRGEGLRCILRRLPADDMNQHAVLLIFRPLDRVIDNGQAPAPILAKVNDLGALSRLTPRETEVLTYIAQGLSSDEVAFRLRRSRWTIDCHRAAISHKLDAHSVADLAVLAHRAGLVRCATTNGNGDAHFKSITAPELLECIVNPKRQCAGMRNM